MTAEKAKPGDGSAAADAGVAASPGGLPAVPKVRKLPPMPAAMTNEGPYAEISCKTIGASIEWLVASVDALHKGMKKVTGHLAFNQDIIVRLEELENRPPPEIPPPVDIVQKDYGRPVQQDVFDELVAEVASIKASMVTKDEYAKDMAGLREELAGCAKLQQLEDLRASMEAKLADAVRALEQALADQSDRFSKRLAEVGLPDEDEIKRQKEAFQRVVDRISKLEEDLADLDTRHGQRLEGCEGQGVALEKRLVLIEGRVGGLEQLDAQVAQLKSKLEATTAGLEDHKDDSKRQFEDLYKLMNGLPRDAPAPSTVLTPRLNTLQDEIEEKMNQAYEHFAVDAANLYKAVKNTQSKHETLEVKVVDMGKKMRTLPGPTMGGSSVAENSGEEAGSCPNTGLCEDLQLDVRELQESVALLISDWSTRFGEGATPSSPTLSHPQSLQGQRGQHGQQGHGAQGQDGQRGHGPQSWDGHDGQPGQPDQKGEHGQSVQQGEPGEQGQQGQQGQEVPLGPAGQTGKQGQFGQPSQPSQIGLFGQPQRGNSTPPTQPQPHTQPQQPRPQTQPAKQNPQGQQPDYSQQALQQRLEDLRKQRQQQQPGGPQQQHWLPTPAQQRLLQRQKDLQRSAQQGGADGMTQPPFLSRSRTDVKDVSSLQEQINLLQTEALNNAQRDEALRDEVSALANRLDAWTQRVPPSQRRSTPALTHSGVVKGELGGDDRPTASSANETARRKPGGCHDRCKQPTCPKSMAMMKSLSRLPKLQNQSPLH